MIQEQSLDQQNALFWNELCGSAAARRLDIQDSSPKSLQKFDDWFLEYFPYLNKYLCLDTLKDKKVLEIGLGYGTVAQTLGKNAGTFFAADISEGPVNFVNYRLDLIGKPQNAKVMSAHDLKFPDAAFDFVVSIGCFHHTGSVKKCIDEAYRVLKPGGRLLFMCYNKYSIRQFLEHPLPTFWAFFQKERVLKEHERARYDQNAEKKAAPFVELCSKRGLREACAKFSSVRITPENFVNISLLKRSLFLNNLAKLIGHDLYVECIK